MWCVVIIEQQNREMLHIRHPRAVSLLCAVRGILVTRRGLVCCTPRLCDLQTEPVIEEDREPIDLKKYTRIELGKLANRLPANHCGKMTPVDITLLGTGGNELSPSFVLKCFSRCYRFNHGEGWMRMTSSYRFRVSKNPLSLFTRAHWENCGGAGGLYYIQEVQHVKQHYLGPQKISEFMRYVQRYTGNWTWIQSRTEASDTGGDDGVRWFKDENVVVSVIPVDPVGDAARAGTVVAYACKLSDMRGKFFPEKAVGLGIPHSPAYRLLAQGYSVLTEKGDVVHPSQVLGDGKKGPTFLVVDCPTKPFLSTLTSNRHLQPEYYAQRGENVALIVHITPLEVLQSESYCKWMAGFGRDTQHLFLHSSLCPGEVGYQHSIRFNMALHLLNPKVYSFPCLPEKNILDKSSLNVSKYVDKDSLIFGRMLMKYTLKPETGVQGADCLPSLEERLESDLESVKGNGALYNKILWHHKTLRKQDSMEAGSVLPSLLKTDHFVRPAFADDAVVTILGTSSSCPSVHRNCSGILVQTLHDGHFLLDCGEGTLQQLYRCFGKSETRNILRNMSAIFISHAHCDHHMGVISILNEIRALTEGDSDSGHRVKLVAGKMQSNRLEENKVCDNLQFGVLNAYSLVRSPYHFSDAVTMETVPVKHIRSSYGCVLRNRGRWSIVYSGDTAPCKGLVEAGRNATLLIHEATFEDFSEERALERNHCTYPEAVRVGQAMNAQFTITTHFSARSWWFPMIRRYAREGVAPAVDFMTVRLSDLQQQKLDSSSSCSALHSIAHIHITEPTFGLQESIEL